jgi:hypothetical protein
LNHEPNYSEVFIPDPIKDLIGSTWNQGDYYRATNVTGKVALNPKSFALLAIHQIFNG